MTQLKKLLVALTPMGAAAYVTGGGTFASVTKLVEWAGHPRGRVASRPARTRSDPLWRTKKALLLLMAIGTAAYFGLSGTFASFSAETSNPGSTVASGTLTMSDHVNSATACVSENSVAASNYNPACGAALALTNVAPGVFGGTALISIKNTGSLDASKMFLWAPPVGATLSSGLTSGISVTSLPITALEGTVVGGSTITLTYGAQTQTFASPTGAAGGAAAIPVTALNANFSYPVGTIVTSSPNNTTVNNTNCFDTKTTVSPVGVGTKGTDLSFNPTAGNPFCGSAVLYVQETTGGKNYCWVGQGSSPQTTSGMCTAPISVTLQTGITSGANVPSLTVTPALNGNVASGDAIVVRSGSTTQTFIASTNAAFGASSISVNPVTATATFAAGSTVTDTTSLGAMNSGSGDTTTLTNFDTAHNSGIGKVPLPPITTSGNVDLLAPVQLAHGATRTFQIGVYLPAPAGSPQNALQGLSSTFGLTWHIDQ